MFEGKALLSLICASLLGAAATQAFAQQDNDTPDHSETSQGVEEAFGPEGLPDVQEGSRPSRASRYETLSGIELEGIRTHSIPLTRLPGTSIFRDSRSTGLMSTTVVVPGDISKRDTDHCTVTLIDKDVVMTAYHCFPGVTSSRRNDGYVARQANVTFGYYGEGSEEQTYRVERVIEADADLDFAILELAVPVGVRPPGETYGYVHVALDAAGDRQLRMFHHPYGYYKMVLQDATCRTVDPDDSIANRLLHQCDTRGGSSGAAVLSYEMAGLGDEERPIAYAIHVSGRAKGLSDPERHFNAATPIRAIAQKSDFIRKIGCQTVYGGIECPDPTFARSFTVYFDLDRTDINAAAAAELDSIIAKISASRGKLQVRSINLKSFSDAVPGIDQSYAVGLTARRGEAVSNYLASRGIAVPISVEPMGLDGAPGRNDKVRRVEITVDYQYFWN